jgi:hypothetical protein
VWRTPFWTSNPTSPETRLLGLAVAGLEGERGKIDDVMPASGRIDGGPKTVREIPSRYVDSRLEAAANPIALPIKKRNHRLLLRASGAKNDSFVAA